MKRILTVSLPAAAPFLGQTTLAAPAESDGSRY